MITETLNPGKADEIKFERVADAGFVITAPAGHSIFLTDEMLDALVDFQISSYIAEGRVPEE
jgi:hypothetical protein